MSFPGRDSRPRTRGRGRSRTLPARNSVPNISPLLAKSSVRDSKPVPANEESLLTPANPLLDVGECHSVATSQAEFRYLIANCIPLNDLLFLLNTF